ncbi:MAG: penicillin-binding protein 1C [Candidatus Edwardsbacteria bacterium]|nr:penicillin-binding protein 1C [Candidatus Edwardsbacteria bacterium]
MRPVRKRIAIRWALAAAAAAAVLALGRLVPPLEFRPLYAGKACRILDRNGELLRVIGRERGFYVPLPEIPPHLVAATLCAEDRRFLWHCGIDPLALGRAALQNLRAGRTVSGASTLTMQLARIILGPRPRGAAAKSQELLLALYLEWRLPKGRILEYYLNNAPYGETVRGCQTAALEYFNADAEGLDPGQAALLAVLPRNPRIYHPRRHRDRVEQARLRLLRRMRADGTIDVFQLERAVAAPQVLSAAPWCYRAPHFCDWLLSRDPAGGGDLRTTVDARLTADLERLLRAYVRKLSGQGISNAAAVVLDNRDLAVLAMVGSADYFDPLISGQCNGATALRQPGSALKPFTYGLALEQGFPASYLLPDLDAVEGTAAEKYLPRNYDERQHGPVRLRTALGCSHNVPAVRMLERLGVSALLDRLRIAGFASLSRPPGHYGPGLTLGNGEVTLLELARAYAALAHGGTVRGERAVLARAPGDSQRVFSPQVAFILTQIMADRSARAPAFGECSPVDLPFPCAAKTGTTKDYRDNWTAGYTADYTVGVWVGNFDGAPMHGVSGISGAGPLFRDVMLALHRDRRPPAFDRPAGIVTAAVCPLSGDAVSPHCPAAMTEYFLAGSEPAAVCAFHGAGTAIRLPPVYRDWSAGRGGGAFGTSRGGGLHVAFPVQDDVFRIDPGLPRADQAIRLRAAVPAGCRALRWVVDGRPLADGGAARWRLEPGPHTVYVTALRQGRELRSPPVRFRVQS